LLCIDLVALSLSIYIPLTRDDLELIFSTTGLADIHFARIIHRDVKTANCFICADNRIKIGDLGVARMLGSRSSCARTMVGTPYYFSPELCENKPYKQVSLSLSFSFLFFYLPLVLN